MMERAIAIAALEAKLGKTGLQGAKGRNTNPGRVAQTIRRKQRQFEDANKGVEHVPGGKRRQVTWNVCQIRHVGVPQADIFLYCPLWDMNVRAMTYAADFNNGTLTTGAGDVYSNGKIEENVFMVSPVLAAHYIKQREVSRDVALHWAVYLSDWSMNTKAPCHECWCLYPMRRCQKFEDKLYCDPCSGKGGGPSRYHRVSKKAFESYEQRRKLFDDADVLEILAKSDIYLYQPGPSTLADKGPHSAMSLRTIKGFADAKDKRLKMEGKRDALIHTFKMSIARDKQNTEDKETEMLKANLWQVISQDDDMAQLLVDATVVSMGTSLEATSSLPAGSPTLIDRAMEQGVECKHLLLAPQIGDDTYKPHKGNSTLTPWEKQKDEVVQYAKDVVKLGKVLDTAECTTETDHTTTEEVSRQVYMEKLIQAGLDDEAAEPPSKKAKRSQATTDLSYRNDF
jgi:hypothetical protein